MTEESGVASGYIHGFTRKEQDRLFAQARSQEKVIFPTIDLAGRRKILEVGSGVGAQTEILLRRYPEAEIQCVDASPSQVARAKESLETYVRQGRVRLDVGDALHLPYPDSSFDGAFLCWFLEHVRKPGEILKEVRRALKPGGVIFCNEVFNASFFVHPHSPATEQFWNEFNRQQSAHGGDPHVGIKLGNELQAAGYRNVTSRTLHHFYDGRSPKERDAFIDYWKELLLSGAPSLVRSGKVTDAIVAEMQAELDRLKATPDSVFYYAWVQARAEK